MATRKAKSKSKSGFVVDNIGTLFTLEGVVRKDGRNISLHDLSPVPKGALAVGATGKILWSGAGGELPSKFKKLRRMNAQGTLVLPGLVDSHTHTVFAGDRSREMEMRLAGASYSEIAAQGGGILNTVTQTREASPAKLLKIAQVRVSTMLKQGVTTLETKTGYGLSEESELKCLKVVKELQKKSPMTILSTFLPGHAVPPEFKGRKQEYVVETIKWLKKASGLCDFVDMFVDEGFFDSKDAEEFFKAAQKFKLPIKLHADELKLTGGTQLAVKYGALSADHLLQITDHEVGLLADSQVTATLLPTTAFFLKTGYAPARKLLEAGARVALATDFNPGTSPTLDISLVGMLAAQEMGMRTEEVVAGLTYNGACALGLGKSKGALLNGYDADFMMIEGESPAQLFYEFGHRPRLPQVFAKGKKVL